MNRSPTLVTCFQQWKGFTLSFVWSCRVVANISGIGSAVTPPTCGPGLLSPGAFVRHRHCTGLQLPATHYGDAGAPQGQWAQHHFAWEQDLSRQSSGLAGHWLSVGAPGETLAATPVWGDALAQRAALVSAGHFLCFWSTWAFQRPIAPLIVSAGEERRGTFKQPCHWMAQWLEEDGRVPKRHGPTSMKARHDWPMFLGRVLKGRRWTSGLATCQKCGFARKEKLELHEAQKIFWWLENEALEPKKSTAYWGKVVANGSIHQPRLWGVLTSAWTWSRVV